MRIRFLGKRNEIKTRNNNSKSVNEKPLKRHTEAKNHISLSVAAAAAASRGDRDGEKMLSSLSPSSLLFLIIIVEFLGVCCSTLIIFIVKLMFASIAMRNFLSIHRKRNRCRGKACV